MASLDNLPEHRQLALQWRYLIEVSDTGMASVRDRAAVDLLVRAVRNRSCVSPQDLDLAAGEGVAVSGSDGRFHLVVNGRPLCVGGSRPRSGVYRHRQWCHWWTNQKRYAVRAPAGMIERVGDERRLIEGVTDSIDYQWRFTLTAETADPTTVRLRDRCPEYHASWPGYQGATPMGRMRARLVEAFGAQCLGCRSRPSAFVDHDHFTGYVRGLLCSHCNTHIDECMHPAGCPYADYLNNPPAAAWKAYYPRSRNTNEDRARTAAKIAAWGHDPLYRGAKAQRLREHHRPASAQTLDLSADRFPR
jgi:hypothetical protein